MAALQQETRILLVYDPVHGVPTSDGLVAEFVADIVSSQQQHLIYTSSSLVVACFQLAVFKKDLLPSDIGIRFNDQKIIIYESGRFDHYPIGFCDHMENILMQLI